MKFSETPFYIKYTKFRDFSTDIIYMYRKLSLIFSIFLIFTFLSFSENSSNNTEIPVLLKGIWEGSDRYVSFSHIEITGRNTDSSQQNNILTIILRPFYQWYNDRAAENSAYSQVFPRDKNNTTSQKAEILDFTINTFSEDFEKNSGVYEITINYGKNPVTIPVCVIEKKLYLNFLVKINNTDENSQQYMDGFWTKLGQASGIKISKPLNSKELTSYFFNENDVYHIRYWLSDMDVSNDEISETRASFSDGEKTFYVNKFIKNGNLLYTCTTGRSLNIRNIEKTKTSNFKFTTNKEHTLCILENEYLTKISEDDSRENIEKIVKEQNSKKKPLPKPIFPPSEIDFHWKDIDELEKYNPFTWNRRNIDLHH